MPLYTSAATGNWSNPASWSPVAPAGGPTLGDRVIINHTIIADVGVRTIGDDTGNAITINIGALNFPITGVNILTCRGGVSMSGNTFLRLGSEAAPVTGTAILRLNDSAVMGVAKYNMQLAGNSRLVAASGNFRVRQVKTTAAITAGDTSFQVTDATGWQPGDTIVVCPQTTSATPAALFSRVQIDGSYTGGLTIPITGPFPNSHASGTDCGNLTSNVEIVAADPAFPCRILDVGSSRSDAFVYVNAAVQVGSNGNDPNFGFRLGVQGVAGAYYARFINSALRSYNGGQAAFSARIGGFAQGSVFDCPVADRAEIREAEFRDCLIISAGTQVGGTSAVVAGPTVVNCDFYATGSGTGLVQSLYTKAFFNGLRLRKLHTAAAQSTIWGGDGNLFVGCNMDVLGSPSYVSGSLIGLTGMRGRLTYASSIVAAPNNIASGSFPNAEILYNNCALAATPTTFFSSIYQAYRLGQGDTVVRRNGSASFRFTIQVTGGYNALQESFPIAPGQTLRIRVNLRRDTTYGAGFMPRVTLSVPGQVDVTTAAPDVADVWHPQEISITNTSAAASTCTITLETQGTVNGLAYFDGLPWPVFVNAARWYGDLFGDAATEGSPFRVADPTIPNNEATVAAYSGISVDHGTQTITVTQPFTAQQLYWYLTWELCQPTAWTPTGPRPKHVSGTGGNDCTTTYNLTLSGAGAITSGNVVAANGATASLALAGLTSSAVLLLDNTGAVVDYQASVTGAYTRSLAFGSTGTWTWVVKRPGYTYDIGTFNPAGGGTFSVTPSTPQKLTPEGQPMYTGSTSTLITVSFSGTTNGFIDVGNGTASLQPGFNETEIALATQPGMEWLASGKGECSIFDSPSGDYLFMTTGWRLRRRAPGDSGATFRAFVISADGIPLDESNGAVQFLTSDSPTTIAAAVWAHVLESGFSASRLLRTGAAAVAGKTSGGPDGFVARNLSDTADQVTGTADADGNRTSAAYGA